MQHVAIIGAGLTGATLAYRLTRAGCAVTVVEAAQPASAASGGSFGWINASFFHSEAHFNLRSAAIAAHHRLDRDLGDTGTIWSGCLWWEEEGAAFDAHCEDLARFGYQQEHLTRTQIAAREPGLTAPDRAVFFGQEGAVDAARLTRRLLAASDATLWTGCPVTAIETTGAAATGICTAQGAMKVDHIILAAGTASPSLLAPLGLDLQLLHRPGLTLTTHPLPPLLSHIIASPALELRQDRQGRLIAPLAASHQSDSADIVAGLPADLATTALRHIQALLPGVTPTVQKITLANRPVPVDGLPVVGPTGIPGLSLAVMHSGVTLAPLIAELLTAELITGKPADLLATFRPARFFAGQ
ncbi:MAG: FAD-dependent oxidoreductase [bacterium]